MDGFSLYYCDMRQTLDIELNTRDIQAIGSNDAVAAFFARLGYNTDVRTPQTPGNLGITNDSIVRPINRIELVADQEGLFQIYLIELTSVTVTHTRNLARAFRNRAGNYLLILTSDYERLDFVLLEKYLPPSKGDGSIVQRQVSIRPRVLTVERRNPGRAHLRVLRRFTWTESDPFAQYDKLLSAYAVADWSEEFFNNRALFSDYYLLERVPSTAEWKEDPKPCYRQLQGLYQGGISKFAGKGEELLRRELLEPALEALGFSYKTGKKSGDSAVEPDYRLYVAKGRGLLALCLVYPWGRLLDGKDYERDNETPDENPGAIVVSLLEKGEAAWVVVTNGKLWRLYSQRSHSRATNYYEIDLEETLVQADPQILDLATAFRYFWLLFRAQAFVPVEVEREGSRQQLSFLDQLLLESEEYARELGERLKERVFEEVFPHLAEGFIVHIQQDRKADLSQEALDEIFQGTLTFLYRLLFLLYAEARNLLPVKEVRGYYEASLTRLKGEVAEVAGRIAEGVGENFEKRFHEDSYDLYDRLGRLFRVVAKGDPKLNVPVYNGGLFHSEPEEDDYTPQACAARFLQTAEIPDLYLAQALDLMTRDLDPKRQDLVFIDYKSLGVRQLGSIYEGLLEFRLRIAPEKMAVVRGRKTEEILPYREAKSQGLDILKSGRGREAEERVLAKGAVYLENDKQERKATGSYYTPDHIVKYIVERAVGPVLQEKVEALRLELRKAQKWNREMMKLAPAKGEPASKYHSGPAVEHQWKSLVDEFFDLKILDPAMGSGHFLVESVDYITDKTLDFLNAFPWNPVLARLDSMRGTILAEMEEQGVAIDAGRLTDVNLLKRHILKRCIYGVDLNPMAVELAKISLWLDCFTLGAPLSFLDHHLRCGNSLVGVSVGEVKEAIEPVAVKRKAKVAASAKEWKTVEIVEEVQLFSLFGSRFTGLLLATDLMRQVGDLADITSSQLDESVRDYHRAADALAPFKRILDLYTSQWFGKGGQQKAKTESAVLDFLKRREAEPFLNAADEKGLDQALGKLHRDDRRIAETALQAARQKRFFHWELEFPEVFYRPRPGTERVVERLEGAGFDAVIGNPPYDVLASEELGYDVSQELVFFESAPVYEPAIRGKKNLYKLFVCRGADVLGKKGAFSFIVPMPLLGDEQAAGVRRMLLERTGLVAIEAFPQKDAPHNRVFPEAKLATTIFVTRAQPAKARIAVRTHPGRLIEEASPVLQVLPEEVIRFDPENGAIPSCTQRDWEIAVAIIGHEKVKRLGEYCRASQGEVNETTDGKKGFISKNPKDGSQILRGSTICLYTLREASQGEAIYLRKKKYLEGKPDSEKARHHEQRRVGWQESSPQNNFRRIIATAIPQGEFCNHLINYIPEKDSQLSLDFVLALLNSRVSDWFFRLGSTNAHVSHYQIYNLPAPTFSEDSPPLNWKPLLEKGHWSELAVLLGAACAEPGVMPQPVAEALAGMSRRLQEIEARRVLKSRSERSRLDPESQPIQDAVDRVLFQCYGLSEEEASYIAQRLGEML